MARRLYLNYDMPFEFAKGLAEFLVGEGYRKASVVAREIFEELDKRLDEVMVVASPNDCFITTFRKTMEKVTAEVEELKKKYTEEK